ncbi:MAG: hypothetical protein JXQ73_07875 [Phycisphaerae bacterium]|nr:hypothetical protein [Phycisphaerae bacterium]
MMPNLAILTAVMLTAPLASAAETSMIRLAGTPEQIGTIWGTINKELIPRDMDAQYLKPAAKAGISRETLIERSAAYVRIAKEIAPHWLVEAKAIARAAGVDEDLYVAFIDGQARFRFLHECTSYATSREHARDGAILFHKTRDNGDRRQATPIVESSLDGINKFIAVTDASRIRCSMMVNEKGLAGSGDYPADKKKDSSTLRLEQAKPQYRGLMAGSILRHIAERASSCAEALAIIEDFVAKGYYAGGDVNASHWLFVDRNGVVLEVCNNSRHVVSKVHTQNVYFSRFNKCEAVHRLREADAVDFHMFHGTSRVKPLLTKQSIAGMTVEIDPDRPDLFTCAWITLPVHSVAFPVLMGQSRTPACLVDGTAYELGKKSPPQTPRWEAMERSMHAEKQRLKEKVKATVAAGNPEPAQVELLEQWSAAQAATLVKALDQPEEAAK